MDLVNLLIKKLDASNNIILTQKIIPLKGAISKYGMNQNGFLYAILYERMNDKFIGLRLVGISLGKGVVWEHKDLLTPTTELRIDPKSGNAYISQKNSIICVNQKGETEKEVVIQVKEGQEIGSFVILPSGFIVSLHSKGKPNAAVLKTYFDGNIHWKTKIEVKTIAFKGLVQMSRASDWKMEQSPPFEPTNWVVFHENELLVANKNVLATFYDMPRTGVGKSYCLDLQTGQLKWETKTSTMQSIAAFKDGKFLIGYTGYGAFNTKLYTPDGHIIDQWKTAGKYLISTKKELTLVEMFSYSKKGDNYVTLKGNGEFITHQKINGHFVIYPILDEFGNCVFWRDGQLILIDADKNKHILMTKELPSRSFNSPRMLLYQSGMLIFSLSKELFMLETNLGKLDGGDWAMKFGNLEGNPVKNLC